MRKAVGIHHGTGLWFSGFILTNPGFATVLIQTDPLEAGDYLFAYSAYSTAAATVDILWIASDGVTIIHGQRRLFGPGVDDLLFGNKITVNNGDILRVQMAAGLVGDIQASIFSFEVDEAGANNPQ